MLDRYCIHYLQNLTYNPKAERKSSLLPLGGIYWDDEIPNFNHFLRIPEKHRLGINHLFRIRFLIWADNPLTRGDQIFWDSCMQQIPDFPLFKRLKLSPEDQQAQADVESEAINALNAMYEEFDQTDSE